MLTLNLNIDNLLARITPNFFVILIFFISFCAGLIQSIYGSIVDIINFRNTGDLALLSLGITLFLWALDKSGVLDNEKSKILKNLLVVIYAILGIILIALGSTNSLIILVIMGLLAEVILFLKIYKYLRNRKEKNNVLKTD